MPSDLDARRLADRARISDIGTAKTLPAYYYTDASVLDIERRELFFRSWQYACHASDLAEPGSYTNMSIFDQDIMLIRGHDGEVRAFYNVCAHRGHRLVEGTGTVGRLVCPYHAWTYRLDGRLIGIRRGQHTTQIPKSEICLPEVRIDQLLDFYFVNLDPEAVPLAEYAKGLADEIAAALPDVGTYRRTDTQSFFDHPFACNWKALVDNYLECYHCEHAHPSLCHVLDCTAIRHTFAEHHMCQHIPGTGDADNAAYGLDLETDVVDGNFWFLFPNTLIGYLPGVKSINISRAIPLGPETCTRHTDYFVAADADMDRLAQRSSFLAEKTVAEDRALVENVQRGMRQRGFNQGLYVIDPEEETYTEEGVRFFHSRYAAALEPLLAMQTR